MVVATLFMMAKTWRQPTCSSGGEWKNCDTFRQYKNSISPAIKINKPSKYKMALRNPKYILPTEESHFTKT